MGQRILIAEDEPSIVVSLEFLLRGAGYEVTIARDGEGALRAAERLPPDLMVLDVMLPVVDGFEVCRRARLTPALQRIPILFLSARGLENEITKGLALGATAYMTKPFGTRELVSTVADLLREEASPPGPRRTRA
jgi:DNA-binding response OmpR family regulator